MSLWRKRIGGISPTVMEVVTYDYYRMAPSDIGFVGITSNIDFWDGENFTRSLSSLPAAANYLADRNVDFIIHFGTPLAVSQGAGYGNRIIEMIEGRTGVPATTSISSAVEALGYMNVKRIAVASPYPREINDHLESYLSSEGFSVNACQTMDVRFQGLHETEPSAIRDFGVRVIEKASDIEALYIPCPQWPAADAVEMIEAETGKLVIASDPADFFSAFRRIGLAQPVTGFGRLLEGITVQSP